tara:strand:- start:56 stop:511 length:456 start_codon:yes stop_codon:yes gene_type:complete
MTTLAYSRSENIIAVDSRITSGDIVQSDTCSKWLEDETGVYFTIGSLSDAKIMYEMIRDGETKPPNDQELEANIIFASNPPLLYGVSDGHLFSDRMSDAEFATYGSGSHFALAALDLGVKCKQAVLQAMKRDIYSGGKVVQYDITKQKFKK